MVGRGQTCDVRFDDPRVSRTHAVLRRRRNAVYIEDLGSSAGTFVNGVTTGTVRELHAGDLLTFASVTARLESGGFGSDQQRAEVIHYDERRYNSHVQHVNQQRENFLREVAATGTKARWLVWMGFVMFVVGYGIFAAVDLNLLKQVSAGIQYPGSGPPQTRPGGQSGAFRSG